MRLRHRKIEWRRKRRVRYVVAALLLVLLASLWTEPVQVHARAFLLISQVLPQIPVKPLYTLTNAPAHTRLTLPSSHGPIVVDLYRPVPRFGALQPHAAPALILAMGVKAKVSDKQMLLSFAQTLSRLGYVVMWPRLLPLERGISLPESPETFVMSVRYLLGLPIVNPQRISFIGFSVGSSLAFVAATDPRVRANVRALVFFGGYYDVFDYLVSLATHTSTFRGTTIAWRPDREATSHVKELLRAEHAAAIARIFTARTRAQAEHLLRLAPVQERAMLRQMSPSYHLTGFTAHIFILHDQGDHFVPYAQSAQLAQALPPSVARTYLISNLFEHTQPKGTVSPDALGQAINLYGFLHATLGYL